MVKAGGRYYPVPRPVPDGRYTGPEDATVEVVETFWTYADVEDREWAKDWEEQWAKVRYCDGAEYTVKAVCLYPVPEDRTDEASKNLLKRLVKHHAVQYSATGHLVACEEHPSGLMLRASVPRGWWSSADDPWFIEYLLVSQDSELLQKTRRWARKLIQSRSNHGRESQAA